MASFVFFLQSDVVFRHQQKCVNNLVSLFSSDVELTVPPRFALASAMSSSGITTELVTIILAKRSAELERFGLFSKEVVPKQRSTFNSFNTVKYSKLRRILLKVRAISAKTIY